jgi:hypothetical protein
MSDFALDGFKAALFCNFHCLISNVDGPTRARWTIHFDETSECDFVHIAQTKGHELQLNSYSEYHRPLIGPAG